MYKTYKFDTTYTTYKIHTTYKIDTIWIFFTSKRNRHSEHSKQILVS